MRIFRFLLAACTLTLLFGPVLARADSCVSGTTLNNLIGQTCSIGDKTFDFTSFFNQGGLPANQVVFTVDTSNPLDPSFTVAPLTTFTLGPNHPAIAMQDVLNYTVTAGAGSLLAGGALTVAGSVTGGTIVPNSAGGGTVVDAFNQLQVGITTDGTDYEACIQSGGGFSGCISTTGNGSASASGLLPTATSQTATGQAIWDAFTDSTGTATFTSATFSFAETPVQTPEPSTLLLLGTGIACSARKLLVRARRGKQ